MGRLHYTNRKIEGLKLGQVINKDLVKRIPPHVGSRAAFRDPSIDLDISGKALTDEGFLEFAAVLVEAVSHASIQGRCTRLEELDLKNNDLSITSLQALTTVINSASYDLRDLDLSGNRIHVNTDDDVAVWQRFLTSFERCRFLRRLDFSGNALGPRGFEVFLRVYAKERPLDLLRPLGFEEGEEEIPVESSLKKLTLIPEPIESTGHITHNQTSPKCKGSKYDSKSPEKLGNAAVQAGLVPNFATTQGLRSIPYLVLCNTDMDDACALHLSFIVEAHHMPRQLLARVPPAKAGPPAQQITAYDESQCRGIIYSSNALLGNAGRRVLELAERRREYLHHSSDQADSGPSWKPLGLNEPHREIPRAESVIHLIKSAKRRPSSQTGALDHDKLLAELDRARSRIQGNVLHEAGACSNDLWRVALKAIAIGRHVQPQRKRDQLCSPVTPVTPKVKPQLIQTFTVPSVSKPKTLKPLTPLTVERDPNRPINPWNTDFRKKNEAIPPTPNIIPPAPVKPKIDKESSKTTSENELFPGAQNAYRSELPCGFSEYAWAKIVGDLVGAEGILSDDQQVSVLRYAMDRHTLCKEREALGLTVATQIWRVLEATRCLAYEMDF